MSNNWKSNIPLGILILFAGVYIGFQLNDAINKSWQNRNVKKFGEVLDFTDRYYLRKTDPNKLVEDAVKGMFQDLDPHTVYISKTEQQAAEEQFGGKFEGIGVEFQIIQDTITVVTPVTGGPSEALGIMAGDRIVKIEGKSAVGWTNEKVIKTLRGEKGSPVNVTIFRPASGKLTDYKIVRADIPLNSVESYFMFDDQTGYIDLTKFSETTADEMQKALEELKKQGMKRIVLDLRNNPGGYLNQAQKVADLFLNDNKLIVYTKGRLPQFDEQLFASQSYPYEKIPLVILVNRGTASASEIVSGAIQDWDRGLIVGETTFGKGLVQKPIVLEDSSAIRLTIAKYYTPSGREIQRDYSNREKYFQEIIDRSESEGDNADHRAEKDSTRKVYKTKHGRTVYAGGGITPDYIVEPGNTSEYYSELRKNNIFYQFVRNYMDKERASISRLYKNDLKKFLIGFSFSDSDLNSFVKFASENKVKFDQKAFNDDKSFIASTLKAFVARDIWKNLGWYSVLLRSDKQFHKAISLFGEAESLEGLSG